MGNGPPAFPARLKMDGLSLAVRTGRVVGLRAEQGQLVLTLEGGRRALVTIQPWPEKLSGLQCAGCRFALHRRFRPDGPTWRLEFWHGEVLVLVIGKGTRQNEVVLPGWSIRPGAVLARRAPTGRRWVNLRLIGPGKEFEAAPGAETLLQTPGGPWVFFLIGASAKPPPSPTKPSNPQPPGRSSAQSAIIADEQPGLTADWIAVREGELR